MSSGSCKLKQDSTTHLWERPKSGTTTPPCASEDVEQQECSFIAGGKAERYSYSGRQFGGGFFTTWYRSCTPWYSPKGPERLCSHKNLHTNIYSIFIHNCQNWKVSKMSFSRWLGKYTAVHSDNGVWLSAKKKQSIKSRKDMKEP